ncbi:lymphocyte antigen 6 complex locus protein G6c-like isoform X1 [Mauremys mutica]|uniref:lymphocyte antigen 6 complex locus protein G6c-like isoform X1 n=1 Tax=Mauremys mutica TaxID=74926 RepID=UPI001D16ACFF|nr:lymphocyte antigen 6 complex locus protein G6c-like isoform X1 [Mauremys mutica]
MPQPQPPSCWVGTLLLWGYDISARTTNQNPPPLPILIPSHPIQHWPRRENPPSLAPLSPAGMSNVLLRAVSLLLCCALAHGLICRVCEFQVGRLCFHSRSPCTAQGQQVCETTKAYIGKVPLFSKYGCSRTHETCNMTEQKDAVFEVSYNRTCCESDLCNAAGPPRAAGLPLLSGLGALLGWWLLK